MGQGYVGSAALRRAARAALSHLTVVDARITGPSRRCLVPALRVQPHTRDVCRFSRVPGWDRLGGVGAYRHDRTYDIRSMESWHQICLTARAHSTLHARHHISIPMYHVASAPPASASHLHAPRTAHALLRVPPRAPPRACAPAPRCRPSAANRRRQPPRRITSSSRLPSR